MTYVPTAWQEDVTALGPTNLNHMEQGIADAHAVTPPLPVQNGKWIKGAGGAAIWDSPTIADVVGLQAALDAKLAIPGAWTGFTPVMTSASLGFAIGNGTVVGAYTQIGKTVHFRMRFTMGTTTTFGAGWWQPAFPIPCSWSAQSMVVATGFCSDASTAIQIGLYGKMESNTVMSVWMTDVANNLLAANVPFLWANLDVLQLSGTYEAA